MGNNRSLPLDRLYDVGDSNLRNVSNDSLLRALDFLDARSLAAVCGASRRLRDVGHHNDRVWEDELERVFRNRLPQPAGPAAIEIVVGRGRGEGGGVDPRPMGPAKSAFVDKANQAARVRKTKYARELSLYRQSIWTCAYRCCAEALVFPIAAVLFVMGVVTVMLGFFHGAVTPQHLIPWFVLCGFVFVFFLLQCYVKWAPRAIPFEESTWRGRGLAFIIDDMFEEDGWQSVHGMFLLIIFLTFEIMFLLRAVDVIAVSWHIVFIPCWVLFLNFCCLPLWPMMDETCTEKCKIFLAVGLLISPVLAFAIMLLLKLDHGFMVPGGLRLAYVLIPGFIGDGLLCIASVFVSFSEHSAWAMGLYCLCMGPLIAFEIVLVLFVDSGDPSQVTGWPIIFAFIPLLCFLFMCNIAAFGVCCKVDWSKPRSRPVMDTWLIV